MPAYHPEFVHFPIALIAVSVILEFFGYFGRRERLAVAAWWTLFAAVATRLYDRCSIHIDAQAHRYVDFHRWVGIALLASAAVLAVWRGFLYFRCFDRVPLAYLATGILILVLVTFQNWLGSELVYANGVGVAPTGQAHESEAVAQRSLQKLDPILPVEVSHHDTSHEPR